jgi:uncharacterized protein (TIGR02145 family)
MKNNSGFILNALFILILAVNVISSCKKDEDDPDDVIVTAAPTASTDTASYISQRWATLNGIITANNLLTTISFEYDTSTAYAYAIPADPDTLSGKTTTKRSVEITGLTPNTTYYYRVKAVNSLGTTYGTDKKFTTLTDYSNDIVFNPDVTYDQVTDIDGNTYKTVQISTQTWMAENLMTKRYKDGTAIPQVSKTSSWSGLSTGALCWYDNVNVKYGALYNWHAVSSGNLCPDGWHVPSVDEWITLTTYLGGTTVTGGKLKETGTVHWQAPNTGASNSTGFTAVPGGYRYYNGVYNNIKRYGYWWSSTEASSVNAYACDLYYGYADIDKTSSDKRSGASIRCVKD